MALFDLNKVAKKVQKSAEGLAKTVSDTAGKMSEMKQEDITKAAKKAMQTGQSAFNAAVAKSKEAAGKIEQQAAKKKETGLEEHSVQSGGEISLTAQGALKIIYFLMAADGEVVHEEKEEYELIGQELDPSFAEYREALIEKCHSVLQGASDKDEYFDIIHEQISDVIRTASVKAGSGIRGKLLLWDLYAIAYSDTNYSDEERRLIRSVCRALHIDSVVAQEMEQALRTMRAIENEEQWLKTTNRQYAIVEARINELADRKQAIMQGVQALIAD